MPKITNLPEATSVTSDDYIVIVDDAGSSPVTQRTTIGNLAMTVTTLMDNLSFEGLWDTASSYAEGDVVSFDGSLYICIQAADGDVDEPNAATDYWQIWVPQGPPGGPGDPGDPGDPGEPGFPSMWVEGGWVSLDASSGLYSKGHVVEHNNNTWIATGNPGSEEPTDGATNWHKVLVRGAKPWQAKESPEGFGAWEPAVEYSAGDDYTPADLVAANGSTYYCVESHTSSETIDPDLNAGKWGLVASVGADGADGLVQGIISGDDYITVNNADPSEPIVGFDPTPLLTDTAFIEELGDAVAEGPKIVPVLVATTSGPTTVGTNAWANLSSFTKDWPSGDLPVGSFNGTGFTPGVAGLWRVTVNIVWPWPMTGTYAHSAIYGYDEASVAEKHIIGSDSPGPNGMIHHSATFPIVVTAAAVTANRNYRVAVKHAIGSSKVFPAASATISWEYMSPLTGSTVPNSAVTVASR